MLKLLGKLGIALTGWRPVGPVPEARRFVLIAAPHTSNWDLLHLLLLAWACGIRVSWMGKHSLFRGPMGPVMRALGGVAVRRDRRNDLVQQMAEVFASRERLALSVPPEGTRGRVDYWKSGFYRIASAAEVPIHFGFLDYPTKTGGFGSWVQPSGNVRADMDVIRAFYSDKVGRYPDDFGPIRLRDEGESGG
jgi:1-acyl-sn-glycerol-3-phosphate acyltransferase